MSIQMIEQLIPTVSQSLTFTAEFTVVDVVNTPEGKWPRALGNVLVMEITEVKRLLVEQIDRLVAELSSNGDNNKW